MLYEEAGMPLFMLALFMQDSVYWSLVGVGRVIASQ